MIPATGLSVNTIVLRTIILSTVALLGACDDVDEPVKQDTQTEVMESPLPVKEWYPSPKHMQQPQAYSQPPAISTDKLRLCSRLPRVVFRNRHGRYQCNNPSIRSNRQLSFIRYRSMRPLHNNRHGRTSNPRFNRPSPGLRRSSWSPATSMSRVPGAMLPARMTTGRRMHIQRVGRQTVIIHLAGYRQVAVITPGVPVNMVRCPPVAIIEKSGSGCGATG